MPGRAFLNKKEFHTGSFKNMEQVWIMEQKRLQQDKMFLEQKKRLLEEKYSEELKKMQVKAGLLPKSALNKMEWMYKYNNSENEKNIAEDFLLGKAVDANASLNPLENGEKRTYKEVNDETDVFNTEKQEDFTRLYDDPLFMMMKEKQRKREEIKNNPMRMKEIFEKIAFQKAKKHVQKIEKLLQKKKKEESTNITKRLEKDSDLSTQNKNKISDIDILRQQMGFNVPRKPEPKEELIEEEEDVSTKNSVKKKKKKSKKSKKSKKIKKKKKMKEKEKESSDESLDMTDRLFNRYIQKRVGANVDLDVENGRLRFKNHIHKKKKKLTEHENKQKIENFKENQDAMTKAKLEILKTEQNIEDNDQQKNNPAFLNKMVKQGFKKKFGVEF